VTALDPNRFAEFFEAVNVDQGRGVEPFPWLGDLVGMLAEGRLPDVIDVPTGFGKTSVIDCWVYALAAQAAGGQRTLPLRLFMVVDRRLVVDQAYDKARAIAERLSSESSGVVGEVAEALRSLHAGDERPLDVVRMRGGVSWDSRWLTRPDQAAVVLGTVDQFGSRLLFRGYGASDSMRPIDAALVGVDSWLVIDEAHIAEPLVDTVRRVRAYQQLSDLTAAQGLRVTAMSATVTFDGQRLRPDLEAQATSSRFPRAAAAAARRLGAAKPVTLFDVKDSSGSWAGNARALGEAMATIARRLDEGGSPCVFGVVANTIATARAAHAALVAAGQDAILLIGRVREFERDRIQKDWIPLISVGASRATLERPLYVVATQTIEVGANIDLDALITECAPLPSLAQRFGRVNRVGEREVGPNAIVHMSFLHDKDRVYGEATGRTWEELGGPDSAATFDRRHLSRGPWPPPSLDFGLRSVVKRMRGWANSAGQAPFAPIVLGAHLERWVTTSPAPFPDQPVAPFLHGVDRGTPEVEIAWRAAPPENAADPRRWQEWLDLVPPVEWEFVSVPIWQAKAFLAGSASDLPFADIEGSLTVEDTTKYPTAGRDLLGVVYRGRGASVSAVHGPQDVAAGDRVVVRSDLGGHDRWGWTGVRAGQDAPPVPDVADLAPTRRRAVLRLSANVFRTWLSEMDAAGIFAGLDADDPASVQATIERLATASLPEPLADLVRQPHRWRPLRPTAGEGASALLLLLPQAPARSIDWASDDDEGSTSQVAHRVSIREHGEAVGNQARLFAEHLGLPAELARAVELAGRWHDLGKADLRFQVMLHDGDLLEARAATEPLAKSGRDPRDPLARRAHRLSGLPDGFRHEAVSARLFDGLVELEPHLVEGVDPELVRHLIVSHHGKARPLLPALVDVAAPAVTVDTDGLSLAVAGTRRQVDWKQPRRFEVMNQRYGWWGLALLETLVRLADMHCSERGR
jgi:CRISPR-associated endonuclease/helicase Cas3